MNITTQYDNNSTSDTGGWAVIIAFVLFFIFASWKCVTRNVIEFLSYLWNKLCYFPNKYCIQKRNKAISVPV